MPFWKRDGKGRFARSGRTESHLSLEREEQLRQERSVVYDTDSSGNTLHIYTFAGSRFEYWRSPISGKVHDPDNGEPARKTWYADTGHLGTVQYRQHGKLQDPAPGVPAETQFWPGGELHSEHFYTDGEHTGKKTYPHPLKPQPS